MYCVKQARRPRGRAARPDGTEWKTQFTYLLFTIYLKLLTIF